MDLTFSNEFEYKPVWAGNRSEDIPIVARFRYLTTPEREKFITVDYVAIEGEMQRRTSFDNVGILKSSLIALEGLKVNGVEIKTASQLLATEGLSALSTELADHASTKNVRPDLKN